MFGVLRMKEGQCPGVGLMLGWGNGRNAEKISEQKLFVLHLGVPSAERAVGEANIVVAVVVAQHQYDRFGWRSHSPQQSKNECRHRRKKVATVQSVLSSVLSAFSDSEKGLPEFGATQYNRSTQYAEDGSLAHPDL